MSTKTRTRAYAATAYRDGKWWTFEIPALSSPSPSGGRIVAMGQARSVAELDQAAREVAALWLNIDERDVTVTVTVKLPENAARLWEASTAREEEARAAVKDAARMKREAVQALTADGISQRDAARILGVSPQRVNQLAEMAVQARR